jgi:hypothetical protein
MKIQKQVFMSHNRVVTASPLERLGLQKTAVGASAFVRFCLRHIWGGVIAPQCPKIFIFFFHL